MGVRIASSQSNTLVTATVVTNTETVVITSPAINLIQDTATVLLFWYILLTTGTATAGLQFLLRRGTTTSGAAVNVSGFAAASATVNVSASGFYLDLPGAVGEQQYSLTVVQQSASGNGTVVDAALAAVVL